MVVYYYGYYADVYIDGKLKQHFSDRGDLTPTVLISLLGVSYEEREAAFADMPSCLNPPKELHALELYLKDLYHKRKYEQIQAMKRQLEQLETEYASEG